MEKIERSISNVLIIFIKIYQWTMKPFLRQSCRFYPSCSVYTIEAIDTCGLIKGLYLSVLRIFRCHPWCAGGYDPVNKK